MTWINNLMDDYYAFLKENTLLKQSAQTDWVEISTPFTGLFNDTVDLYAKPSGNRIILSDDGHTMRNLELSGMEVSRSPKRKEILRQILLNYGVRMEGDELVTEATEKDFPQKKLNMLMAISETSDMYYLSRHTVASVFREDVKNHLDQHEIVYTPHFISKGSTGLEFTFDFQIAYRKTEIVIKSFNTVNKMNLPQFLFTWDDIKKVRQRQTDKEVIGLAFINDIDRSVNPEYIEALNNRGAKHILWSEKDSDENIEKLRAA